MSKKFNVGVRTTHNPPSDLSPEERHRIRETKRWTQEINHWKGRITKLREYLERTSDPVEEAMLEAKIKVIQADIDRARERLADIERLSVN